MPDLAPPGPDTTPPSVDDVEAEALFQAVAAQIAGGPRHVPAATYRVQLGEQMGFGRLQELLEGLRDLGITTVYVSPIWKARRGSQHGYDIVDHRALNPALGTRAEFDALTSRMAEIGLGLLVDFVPNHMGIGSENAWWLDVLENGPGSLCAPYFDIDWAPSKPELRDKVLLPVLADPYGRVLEDGLITLTYGDGQFQLRYGDHALPVRPEALPLILDGAIEAVTAQLGEEHDAVLELQSIVTGLKHLPGGTETRRARIMERRREKEILRRRLAIIVAEQEAVAAQVRQALVRINGVPGDARSFDELDRLVTAQNYRLCCWRVAAEEINYRRFFDNNDLAAIRMEHPQVFEQAHGLLFELVRLGRVQGVRVDHPDGLWNPQGYLAQLQRGLFLELCHAHLLARAVPSGQDEESAQLATFARLRGRLADLHRQAARDPRAAVARPVYTVVEKILVRSECLPETWPVYGTSGYDFAAACSGVFVDGSAGTRISMIYEDFSGIHTDFDTLVYETRKLILRTSMASELAMLGQALSRLSSRDRHARDFTQGSLTQALAEIISSFPVYRTYIDEASATPGEEERIAVARSVRLALYRNPAVEASVFQFIGSILLLDRQGTDSGEQLGWRQFVMRVQQLTGPVMAKGVEDTAFYVYNRLVSLCEVGDEPERFGTSVAAFHRLCTQRQRLWPWSLSPTSTHDSKRSADLRARIHVLSEIPEQWAEALAALGALAQPLRIDLGGRLAPERNEQYLLFQSLIGVWPWGLPGTASPELASLTERIVAYMVKACREAKVNTSWLDTRPEYPQAIEAFVRAVLAPDAPLWDVLRPLADVCAWHGMWSALGMVVLKMTAPGIPDLYQGEELWNFCLVDPDNRRPVDHAARQRLMAEVRPVGGPTPPFVQSLLDHPEDGRIKLHVTRSLLQLRQQRPDMFDAQSAYAPLAAGGLRAEHALAFARRTGKAEVIVIVGRLTARLCDAAREMPTGLRWAETWLPATAGRFRDVLTGAEFATRDIDGASVLALDEIFATLPVAVVERIEVVPVPVVA